MSQSISELEDKLQKVTADLTIDESHAEELQQEISKKQSTKLAIESELADLRDQQRRQAIEAELGDEVHKLREIADRINANSRQMNQDFKQFDALVESIKGKTLQLGRKPQFHVDFRRKNLPVILHREGEPSFFIINREKSDKFRDSTRSWANYEYHFNVDAIVGERELD